MRLGFCGVGRWASKLAEQFRACGAEVVAYDRRNPTYVKSPYAGDVRRFVPELPGFGKYQPWRDQLEDPRIDAIIAMADPETTATVALACIAAAKPCMATKPLMVTEMPELKAPLYVDLWRLWGDRWKWARERIQRTNCYAGSIHFFGNGPDRTFPGALDYGPHAVAFLIDAFPYASMEIELAKRGARGDGREMLVFLVKVEGRRFEIRVGNGASGGHRQICIGATVDHAVAADGDVLATGHVWDEPSNIDPAIKDSEIRAMCQSFLNDIHESNVSTYTLDLSIRGMRLLQQAREMAGAK